ncbi:hypothetical protein HPB52_014779 [Rhipicephalus sanguineus]|uniref:Uncharacterized protein n=1 Tax=Rhipicephalus sanguineus TaxID=34632 RepID=A0A9D4QG80_RHISA|nr:hypothetical protein HPB52_014779 [Rhipicephalus sanguineus]
MADTGTTVLDTMSKEVNDLFRKGLELDHETGKQSCLTDMCSTHGAKLKYKEITKKEAAVLRRMLSTGPPVRTLSVFNISLFTFRVAFYELEECPSLKKVYIHIDCNGKDLGTSLSAAFRCLRTLELRCENTGTGFAKDVADYIRQNKSLREIVIWNSCGGDEGAATLAEALAANDSLKTFSLAEVELSSDILIGFAKMLATNSTLEVVNLKHVCPVEKDKVCWLTAQKRYAGVFKRLDIQWTEELLPVLAALIRKQACCPELFVSVTSSIEEGVVEEFSDALAAAATLRRLVIESDIAVADALHDRFYADATASALRKTVLHQIWGDMGANRGKERHLVSILDALKTNCSIEEFTMWAVMEGADALRKLRSSAPLVEEVKELTGKTTDAVLGEIQSSLARLTVCENMEDTSTSLAPHRYR